MKKLFCAIFCLVILLFTCAIAEDAQQYTITFHSGDGVFSEGVTENVVTYGYAPSLVTKYAHTPNVSDTGTQNGYYSNSVSYNTVVTIPGAESLNVTITYQTESTSYDWVCMWAGSYPNYTASNYSSSLTGKLGGSTKTTKTYTVTGNSVTFGFISDSSGNSYYGYYAVVTGTGIASTVVSGEYKEPVSLIDDYTLLGWTTSADGSGDLIEDVSVVTETTDLYAVYGEPVIDRGIYRDVHWRIRTDGTLILGLANQNEEFTRTNSQSSTAWPWYQYRSSITGLCFEGTVACNGVMTGMFYNCSYMTTANLAGFSTTNATNLASLFSGCSSLTSLDLSGFDTSNVGVISYLCYNCASLEYIDLSSFDLSSISTSSNSYMMFSDCSSLRRVKLGDKNFFRDSDGNILTKLTPPVIVGGAYTAGTWSNENGLFSECTPTQLAEEYWNGMSGYWVADIAEPVIYAVFVADDETLYFVKAAESIGASTSPVDGTIESISGRSFTGRIVPVVGDNTPWSAFKGQTKHVVVVDEIVVPSTMSKWFYEFSVCEDMNLAKLDTSNVDSLYYAFYRCSSLTSLSVFSFDTSNVQTCNSTFYNCSSLQAIDISHWNCSKITTMYYMFAGCSSLAAMDLSGLTAPALTSMSDMFYNCTSLEWVDLSDASLPSLTSLDSTFQGCTVLEAIDFSGAVAPKLSSFSSSFKDCVKLSALDLSGFGSAGVSYLNSTFYNCSSLESLDISSFDVSKARSMTDEFYNCVQLKRIVTGPVNPFRGVSDSSTSAWINPPTPPYSNSYGITTQKWVRADRTYGPYSPQDWRLNYTADFAGVWVWDSLEVIGYFVYVPEDDETVYLVVTEDPEFYTSGSVQTLHSISGTDYTGNVYIIAGNRRTWSGFSRAKHVVVVDDMSPVSTSSWFSGFSACTDMDLEKLDMSRVTDASYMFSGCRAIPELDLSNWNTSNVTDMRGMFTSCAQLTELDLSSFDTSSVENVLQMFSSCQNLRYLDMSSWDLSSVKVYLRMFDGCSSLERFRFGDYNPVRVESGGNISFPQDWLYYLEGSEPMVGPYKASELAEVYTSNMKGVWVHHAVTGSIYAVFDDTDNTMYFLRSEDEVDVGSPNRQTVHSVGGQEVVGVIYSVDTAASQTSSANPWGSVILGAEHVVCLDQISLSGGATDWFNNLSVCTDMDVRLFDVTQLYSMYNMFAGCSSLIELDLSGWTPANCRSYNQMFYNCSSLTKLDLRNFTFYPYVSGSASAGGIFYGCSSLRELDVSGNYGNYCQVDFSPLVSLERIHLGAFFDYNSYLPGAPATWTREDGMYGPYRGDKFYDLYGYVYYGSAPENRVKSGWWIKTPGPVAVINYNYNSDQTLYIFETMDGCQNGSQGTMHRLADGTAYTGTVYYLATSVDSETWTPGWRNSTSSIRHAKVLDPYAPENHSTYNWFYGSSLIDVDLSNLDFSDVTSMHQMFSNCASLKSIDVSGWNTSKVKDMGYLFYQCPTLEEIVGLDTWDVSQVTDFTQFCSYDYALRSFDAPSWKFNENERIGVYKFFRGCSGLESINIGDWDTSNFGGFYMMFAGCKSLREADLHNWTPGGVSADYYYSDTEYMFEDCDALTRVDLSSFWNISSEGSMFYYKTPIQSLTVGPNFKVRSSQSLISIPSSTYPYKWVDESGTYGPWTTDELIANYPEDFAGTWIWDIPDTTYYIKFEAPDGTLGSMPMVKASSIAPYTLPANKFVRPGATFSYWKDNNLKGYGWGDKGTIGVNYFEPGDVVILTAVFNSDGGGLIDMQDGGFDFKLKKNQKAVFENLPVDINYYVYEDTPYGWQLIADQDSSGIIQSNEQSEALFGNSYLGDKCTLALSGEKFFDGKYATKDEFQFELLDENGNVVDTTLTRAGGDIVFDSLVFTPEDVGREIIYTVREVIPESDNLHISAVDGDITYDTHEERVRIVVSYRLRGDGVVYSRTSNLNQDGSQAEAITSIDPQYFYYHTGNIQNDGSRYDGLRINDTARGDYETDTAYTQVVTLRNVVKMHVKLTYSNPRGEDGLFAIWSGNHEEVRTGEWTDECNLNNTFKRYSGGAGIYTDEFDIIGDSFSLRYISNALALDDSSYDENSNFGYYMEVMVDERYMNGGLRADGTLIRDYVNNQDYIDVINIPGAEKLQVEVVYTAPRNGSFLVWEGNHSEVPNYTDTFNENTALKSYTNVVQDELLSDTFEINGDSLTVLYRSEAISFRDETYSQYSNYGYYMKITPVLSENVGQVPFVASTPNVGSNGVQNGNYESGRDYVKVVSIPGASKLNFTIKFNMGSYDRLRLFTGNHPEYTYETTMNLVGDMTGWADRYTYTVNGDTATLIFHADDRSTGGNGYGYYATYVSDTDMSVLYAEAVYDEDGAVFYNLSDVGQLHLGKVRSDDDHYSSSDTFIYELAFVTDNGQSVDLSLDNLVYYSDEETNLSFYDLRVNHILQRNDGTCDVLGIEHKTRLVDGDAVTVRSGNYYGSSYVKNDYFDNAADEFIVYMDQPLVVNMYYEQTPFTLTIKHVAVNTSMQELSVLDVDTQQVCSGDPFVINANQYDDYIYVSSNRDVTVDSAIHGVMNDGDMTIKLFYVVAHSITYSHIGNNQMSHFELVLPESFTGLRTGQYGDMNFVDGIASVDVVGGTDGKTLRFPCVRDSIIMQSGTEDRMEPFVVSGSTWSSNYTSTVSWSYAFSNTYDYNVKFRASSVILTHDAGIGSRQYKISLVSGYSNGRTAQYGNVSFEDGIAYVTVLDGSSVTLELPVDLGIQISSADDSDMPYLAVYNSLSYDLIIDNGIMGSYRLVTADDPYILRFCDRASVSGSRARVIKYSHTANINDAGVRSGRYATNLRLTDVVTIPGAESVHVKLQFGTPGKYDAYLCMWAGAHPEYSLTDYYYNMSIVDSSITGALGDGYYYSSSNNKEYDVNGDSVTFSMWSSSYSGYTSESWGYYAIITAIVTLD